MNDSTGPQKTNQYVGTVGERLVDIGIHIKQVRLLSEREHIVTMVKMTTFDGSRLTWFASGNQTYLKVGDTMSMSATVKKHSEYQGMRDTQVTRCVLKPLIEKTTEKPKEDVIDVIVVSVDNNSMMDRCYLVGRYADGVTVNMTILHRFLSGEGVEPGKRLVVTGRFPVSGQRYDFIPRKIESLDGDHKVTLSDPREGQKNVPRKTSGKYLAWS